MRAMRTAREHAGTQSPQALRPQPARPGTAGMGRPHGENAPEDPHGLPGLPRRHPQGKVTAGHGITREPDAMKVARPVRGEAAGKRTSHSGWHLARRPTHALARLTSALHGGTSVSCYHDE